jgi:predicted nuclease of predicted toxin-antitoxin system
MLADVYPQSVHVSGYALDQSDDRVVWEFAKTKGLTIVSKDSDFHHLSFLLGAPPKVVWLDVGNCSTSRIESLLRTNVVRLIAFHRDPDASFLILT